MEGKAPAERIEVSPEVLAWARRSAGYTDAAVAAKKIGTSEAVLARWESGEVAPTIKQLRKMAKVYRRPLAVLLLSDPPLDFQPVRDFRSAPASGRADEWSPALRVEFRRALSQRDVFLELAELAAGSIQEAEPLPRVRTDSDAEDAADVLRAALDVAPDRGWSSPYDALNAFLSAVERFGILVIQTRDVPIREMRGFSVSERPFPVIALNGSDWARPRLFTLMHELTHLAINASGLCDLHETRGRAATSEDQLEQFCNRVAAATLMPAPVVRSLVANVGPDYAWTLDELAPLSRRFGASREAVLLRLVTLGIVTWDLYWARKPELDAAYEEARRQEVERRRDKETPGGPNYYVVKARDLGHGYVTTVLDAFRSRSISSLDVADYLEVRFEQLPKLESVLR
ncbi:MAG: XRE family transcriptional regulator [Actinomycetota bacterium]|nr:XRE family transcriptional regulator [Actinomycetota bacterium]